VTSASALMAPAPMFSPKVDKQLADRPLSCKRDRITKYRGQAPYPGLLRSRPTPVQFRAWPPTLSGDPPFTRQPYVNKRLLVRSATSPGGRYLIGPASAWARLAGGKASGSRGGSHRCKILGDSNSSKDRACVLSRRMSEISSEVALAAGGRVHAT
jgi:hypothetical protein